MYLALQVTACSSFRYAIIYLVTNKPHSMKLNLRTEDVEKLHLAKAIIEKEYRQHYTSPQLAQKVRTNEYKLKHGFKQTFHMSLYEFLTNIRIEKAKDLLEYTEDPVSRVAINVGFPDGGSFCKRFKQYTGLSPLKYRQMRLTVTRDQHTGVA
ncbi:helix-turn-helix transcriptional regulator [Niastella caeni]|uniref:Helix-turn-helix transcriptional regulator n=1 Tax=Niastella caeni TaxID=2569763 RepID=A0A4S8HU96_9BACT|nr:AraC family transcriptional regulator [Niastella caeni]THU39208.1 helix-turn-helix transcriptional regulator [Niastella caeni]